MICYDSDEEEPTFGSFLRGRTTLRDIVRNWDRERDTYRNDFCMNLQKGDILISSSNRVSGVVGHAAIMATNTWVVEMPGGGVSENQNTGSSSSSSSSSSLDLKDNNRRITKSSWFDVHSRDTLWIYRCPNHNIADKAADWAYTNYYNNLGGELKTIHKTYSLWSSEALRFDKTEPSYCSKLVLQSYYYGTKPTAVISPLALAVTGSIVPKMIPSYFTAPYALTLVKTYQGIPII